MTDSSRARSLSMDVVDVPQDRKRPRLDNADTEVSDDALTDATTINDPGLASLKIGNHDPASGTSLGMDASPSSLSGKVTMNPKNPEAITTPNEGTQETESASAVDQPQPSPSATSTMAASVTHSPSHTPEIQAALVDDEDPTVTSWRSVSGTAMAEERETVAQSFPGADGPNGNLRKAVSDLDAACQSLRAGNEYALLWLTLNAEWFHKWWVSHSDVSWDEIEEEKLFWSNYPKLVERCLALQ
ncbi:MAG: hypothetical protein Q9227_004981 [Pyrenula ochraceoflavens]